MPVGPPVLDSDEDALSIDDLPSVQSPSGVAEGGSRQSSLSRCRRTMTGSSPARATKPPRRRFADRQAGQESVEPDHDGPATDAEPAQHSRANGRGAHD